MRAVRSALLRNVATSPNESLLQGSAPLDHRRDSTRLLEFWIRRRRLYPLDRLLCFFRLRAMRKNLQVACVLGASVIQHAQFFQTHCQLYRGDSVVVFV